MQLKDKKCGILAAVSSLPSDYGIGSFDEEAYKFIDFLKDCNQDYWQILPLCPIGKGNSPYSSPASFGGEILYIDLKKLKNQGLIKEIPNEDFKVYTDYDKARAFKIPLLKQAAKNFKTDDKEYKKFCEQNNEWLQSYSLFMAIRDYNHNKPFQEWEAGLKYKLPFSLDSFISTHKSEIEYHKITQFFFFTQYNELKNYANQKGIKIIGDIPFYVSPDSADVWDSPDLFLLNRDMTPKTVAGVPPDLFSDEGQLWGNPVYNWEEMRKNNYLWWQKRLSHNGSMYDILRIDHFRAFANYYAIPHTARSAKEGEWIIGEDMNFWKAVTPAIKEFDIIAEDLGVETPEVENLIKNTGFPNMKVLQFAFDSDLSDPFLPQNYENSNCICYTGTHDNNTTYGWYETLPQKQKNLFLSLSSDIKEESIVSRLIAFGMKSTADTVIIPLQDYMELSADCRMNTPSTESGNWEWRFEKSDLNDDLKNKIINLIKYRKSHS